MDKLLEQERIARLKKDETQMYDIMSQIISHCHTDTELLTYLKLLSKRKAQLKPPLKKLIHSVYTSKLPSITTSTIHFYTQLLKEIVEGKFYLEDERICLTITLKEWYEQNGNDNSALNAIFSVPVETFSIDEDTKVAYQLEVLRLCVKIQDWTKCELISKRVRHSYFKETTDKTNEIKYTNLMIGVCLGQKNYGDACMFFKTLYAIDNNDPSSKILYCSFFAILSTRPDKLSILQYCLENKDNTDQTRKVIRMFMGNGIVPVAVSAFANEIGEIYVNSFVNAINEHNFVVVSKYFEMIRMGDLCKILQCGGEECVRLICENKMGARIDQARDIVSFGDRRRGNVEKGISKVLDRLVRVNHLIQKDNLKVAQ